MGAQGSMEMPEVGMRVVLTSEVGRFPDALVAAGAAGEVTLVEEGRILVRLDARNEGLDGWDNQLIWDSDVECQDGEDLAELFWSQVEPEAPAPAP